MHKHGTHQRHRENGPHGHSHMDTPSAGAGGEGQVGGGGVTADGRKRRLKPRDAPSTRQARAAARHDVLGGGGWGAGPGRRVQARVVVEEARGASRQDGSSAGAPSGAGAPGGCSPALREGLSRESCRSRRNSSSARGLDGLLQGPHTRLEPARWRAVRRRQPWLRRGRQQLLVVLRRLLHLSLLPSFGGTTAPSPREARGR